MALVAAIASAEYRIAKPGYRYSFPRDHFDHPDFRTEWWYYTGNLRSTEGKRFGFELVFFRQAQRRGQSNNPSAWRVDDLYMAHLALTDIEGKRFESRKRLNRAGPGIAGVSFEQKRTWNGNWSATWRENRQTLEAVADKFRFRLELTPAKPPVTHGKNGVSQKAEGAGKASHYVSFSRSTVTGAVTIESAAYQVTGTAWMDHEWFTHQLEESQTGWDWFSVQLDDNRELMLFQLRRKDGTIDVHSAGTFVDAGGTSTHLNAAEFRLEPVRYWISPATKAKYPVEWRIRVPKLGIELRCEAALDSQELKSDNDELPTYWEGAVTFSGSATGVGYLEMTGYDRPVRLQ